MLLANFNRKEHLRHRAVSLRQHGFLVLIAIGACTLSSLSGILNESTGSIVSTAHLVGFLYF